MRGVFVVLYHTGPHFAWQRHREEGERKRRGKREGRKKNPDGGTPLFSEIFAIPESESPIVFAITLRAKKKKLWRLLRWKQLDLLRTPYLWIGKQFWESKVMIRNVSQL